MVLCSDIQEPMRYGIVIPACNEEEALGPVLDELLAAVNPWRFEVVVGVNGTTDGTAAVAQGRGVIVAETARRGYGHGCCAAIELLSRASLPVDAYIFFAADGASDPHALSALTSAYEKGFQLVLGRRTRSRREMGFTRMLANKILGIWCGVLTGRFFSDVAPLRLIDRHLFEQLDLRDNNYGWTIEAQVRAVVVRARICEVPVGERSRIAGAQKVSGVNAYQSFKIGVAMFKAAYRARFRTVTSDVVPIDDAGALASKS